MALTYTDNGGGAPDGSDLTFTYSFETIKTTTGGANAEVKVSLDGETQATTKYTVNSSPASITFNNTSIDTAKQESTGAPKSGVKVRVYRDTAVATPGDKRHTFQAGSAIKANALNDIYEHSLFSLQERQEQGLNTEDLSDGIVTSAKIADGTIATADLADGSVTTAKIAADAVTGAKIADDQINSEHYVDGSIDTAHIAADQITSALIADDQINSEHYVDGSIDTAHIADLQVTTAKIAADAITGAKIADDSINSEHYVDASIDTAHIADSQVTTAKIADANITTAKIAADAIDGTKIADDAINSEHYTDGSIDTAHIADSQVTTAKIAGDAITEAKIADDAVTTDHIADAKLTTLAGMQSGTASILAGGTALTATLTEINTVVDGKGVQTTISDSDAHYPTSGAVVDYVAAQIAPIGGLEVIANEDSFPTTQPASGVVISIADAAGIVVNGSGVSTTARKTGSGSDDVTINNFPSSLYSETLASGVGLMVTSTGSSDTYNYHKLLAAETDVKQLSDDINDFNARYRVNAGEPSSNNDEGDLCYDTNADKMKVYDSSTSAWKEVTSTGDFKFLVAVDAGTTTAATFDGSDTSFDLKEATNSGSAASVTNVNQLMIVLNGVVQKPNAGSWSGSGEGFYLTDADTIRFATAPPTGSTCFIVQSGSAVSIPTPGDNTVATAKLQNLAVTTAKIAADAIDGTKLADDAVAQEHIADEAVDEARIQISNAGSNGQYLQKQSGNTGGLTWATPAQYTTPLTTRGDILYRAASADARLAKGTEGQYLKIGANDPEWADVVAATADSTMWENNLTVSNNYTIASTKGAHSVGPITLNATVTVNGRWVIS